MIQLGEKLKLTDAEIAYLTELNDGVYKNVTTVRQLYLFLKEIADIVIEGEDEEARCERVAFVRQLLPESTPFPVFWAVCMMQAEEVAEERTRQPADGKPSGQE